MVLRIHDYKCQRCSHIVRDTHTQPHTCVCGGEYDITYELWDDLNYTGDRNALSDSKGYRRKFGALEDPTCSIEMGLAHGPGIETFSEEQRRYYAGKVLTDGDSPDLRKEILRQRKRNLDDQGIASPETM